ncbi:phosphinothricin acetyltransferase [Capnocytophaga sp. oral taxon 324]|uniref:phosphinothricin acetyltransferase n=1 Tax=Capnocytophaga sp. oral taxon 324 TaxID=712211 RepID=UPI001E4E1FA5|nr:phosphinothricin acetyltransferase [Capnocytophaga sp. oral taxon 324]
MYSVSPRTPEGGLAGKGDKPLPLHILRSRGAHTQLSLTTFKRGNVMTEKQRNDEGQMTNDEGNVRS